MEPLTKEHIKKHFEDAAEKAFHEDEWEYDSIEVYLKREAFIEGCWEGFNFCLEGMVTHDS